MRLGIDKKIISLFILSITILGIALGLYFLEHEKRAIIFEFDERAKALSNNLAITCEYPVLFRDYEMLSSIGSDILKQRDVSFCKIIDEDGQVLFQKGEKEKDSKTYITPILTKKIKEAKEEEIIFGMKEKGATRIGSVYLTFSLNSIRERLRGAQRIIGLIIIIGIMFASLSITLLVRGILGEPIKRLVMGTRIVGGGDLNYRVDIKTNDEIGDLANAFNQMTEALKSYEDKVIKAERLTAIAQIAAEIAHEIKNPLQVIKVGSSLLKRIIPETDIKAAKTINQMDNALIRTTGFVDSLLNISRPVELRKERVNINELIKGVIEEMREAVLSNIEVKEQLSAIPEILADSDRLKEVVLNLFKNAAESMEGLEKRVLEVKTEKEGEFIKIIVSDTGKGIEKGDIDKIFDPFHTTKKKGIGLGLPICQRFIKAHNGRIDVESKPRAGTTFTIRLPKNKGGEMDE